MKRMLVITTVPILLALPLPVTAERGQMMGQERGAPMMGQEHGQQSMAGSHAMADMSEGEVRKVDSTVGKLTLRHGPLANLDMPAMTMVFRVKDPAWLVQLKVGDKVRFVAERVDGNLTVTAPRARTALNASPHRPDMRTGASTMGRIRSTLLSAVLAAAFLTAIPVGVSAEALAPQTSSEQGVTVLATPRELSSTAKVWEFEIVLQTHSQDLTDDLAAASTLIADGRLTQAPAAWEGAPPGRASSQGRAAVCAGDAPAANNRIAHPASGRELSQELSMADEVSVARRGHRSIDVLPVAAARTLANGSLRRKPWNSHWW